MLNLNLRVVLVSAVFAGLAINAYACGDDGGGNSGPACTAFQVNPAGCTCTTGGFGSQTCLADGSGYAPCVCGQGGTGGGGGFAGTGGTGAVGGTGGGSGDCGAGEVCNSTPLGVSVCGAQGATLPAGCSMAGVACGTSGGSCQALGSFGMFCVKMCTGAGGTGGTGGTAGVSGTGGTGGTGGTSGTGGTGGTSGTGGTGGTSGTGGTAGTPAPGCMGGETCNAFGPLMYCGMTGAFLPASCPTIGQPCGASGGMCVDATSFSMGFLTTACIKTCTP